MFTPVYPSRNPPKPSVESHQGPSLGPCPLGAGRLRRSFVLNLKGAVLCKPPELLEKVPEIVRETLSLLGGKLRGSMYHFMYWTVPALPRPLDLMWISMSIMGIFPLAEPHRL